VEGWEGCLSVPGFRGLVPRHRWVRVKALTRAGEPLDLRAEDYFARILQHECDHLEGKVYLDRMAGLRTLCFTEEFERFGAPK
jgi:peptide deformylase